MYIQNLYSEEAPQLQSFGSNFHVPLNIRENEDTEKKSYLYDLVENVETPISVENILNAVLKEEFDTFDLQFIMSHPISKDERVKKYKNIVAKVTSYAEALGYK